MPDYRGDWERGPDGELRPKSLPTAHDPRAGMSKGTRAIGDLFAWTFLALLVSLAAHVVRGCS